MGRKFVLVRAVNDIPLLPSIFLCHPRKFSDTFFFFLTCPPFLWIVFTSLGLSIRQSLHPLHVAVSVVSSSLVSFRQKNPRFFLLRKATIVFLFLNIFFSWISVERIGVVLVHGWRCLTQHTRILVSSFSCRILSLRRSARSIFLTFYITYQKFRRKNFDGNNFGEIFGNSAEKVSAGKNFDQHFPRIFPPKFLVYSLLLIHVKNYFLEFAFWLAFHVRSA